MSDLPIFSILEELEALLSQHPQVILQAEPGAGKSTQVPLKLLQSPDFSQQKILLLEPRRMAARSLATFLASQINESVGQTVGYQVRNQRKVSRNTRLEVITEGVLTARLQNDPELSDVGLIIFDEFHERSIHADFGLALCLEVQQSLREDLKLLIMSATLDFQSLAAFLPDSASLYCEGRQFPVTTTHGFKELMPTIKQALAETDGDILVFLSGQREIRQALESAEKLFTEFECLPLYGALPPEQQDKVFKASEQRRIIFSTNIAETSVTLPNINAVVDSGEIKRLKFDPNSGMSRLEKGTISTASAEQRKGRAGRLSEGKCYRLWPETQTLIAYEPEEITQVDLTDLTFQCLNWGSLPSQIDWLTPPPEAHIKVASNLIQHLGFSESNHLTESGRQAFTLPLDVRLAKMIQRAEDLDCLSLACDLAAVLSEQDIFYAGEDKSVRSRIEAFRLFELDKNRAIKQYPLKNKLLRQVVLNRNGLTKRLKIQYQATDDLALIGILVAAAFPDRIGQQRAKQNNFEQTSYLLSNGRSAFLANSDAVNADYIAVFDLDGQNKQGRIYLAEKLSKEALLDHFSVVETESYVYDANKKTIKATLNQQLGSLILASKPIQNLNPQQMEACLLAAIQQTKLELLPWDKASKQLLARTNWLAEFDERFPKLDQKQLLSTLKDWCAPYLAGKSKISELNKLPLTDMLKSLIGYELMTELDSACPVFYQAPTGKKYPIEYQAKQAKVSLKLQELFGETQSPKLAFGQISLTFELLSPAMRPIQLTADLALFWQSSYQEVAKEMRGRYPKHRWPEDPMTEKPGHSIKQRKH